MAKKEKRLDSFEIDTIEARELHMSYGQYQAYKYTHSGSSEGLEKVPNYLENKKEAVSKTVSIPQNAVSIKNKVSENKNNQADEVL